MSVNTHQESVKEFFSPASLEHKVIFKNRQSPRSATVCGIPVQNKKKKELGNFRRDSRKERRRGGKETQREWGIKKKGWRGVIKQGGTKKDFKKMERNQKSSI